MKPDDPMTVKVLGVAVDERPPLLRFDPTHPDSNEDGYVAMPNVDPMEEMVNLMLASRSYEANVAAFNATKTMTLKPWKLDGRNQSQGLHLRLNVRESKALAGKLRVFQLTRVVAREWAQTGRFCPLLFAHRSTGFITEDAACRPEGVGAS